MDLATWFSFAGAVAIIAITPGPSVLLATANSMSYGPQKTLGTIVGDLSANLLQMLLASLGLASIVVASGELFQLIKWMGVAYLIFLGLRKIFSKPSEQQLLTKKGQRSFRKLYMEGFLMSAANPKAIVFFAVFFPLFINVQLPFWPQVGILSVTYLLFDGLALLTYVFFAERLKKWLEDQQQQHWQNRIIGGLLIFSGVMLSLVKRTGASQ